MNNQIKAWIERNEESLRAEYRAYGIQHDYDLDGVMPFGTWAINQYYVHLEYQRWQKDLEEQGGTAP